MSTIAQNPVARLPRQRDVHDRPSTEERFEEFHAANPDVYDLLVASARAYRRQTGQRICGMSLLFGRVRWVLALRTSGDDFKINNDFAPFYSRLIMANERDLDGMFRTRRSVADGVAR